VPHKGLNEDSSDAEKSILECERLNGMPTQLHGQDARFRLVFEDDRQLVPTPDIECHKLLATTALCERQRISDTKSDS